MSDQPVPAGTVLRAVLEVQRRGNAAVLEQIEQEEPKLAEFLMESLGMIHQRLLALGGPARRSRRVYREVESLALTCILALRHHHRAGPDDPAPPDQA